MDSFSLSPRASMTQYIICSCELITMSLNMDHKESNVGPPKNEWVRTSSVLTTAMPKSNGLYRRDCEKVKHIRRVGIEFAESILRRKGRIEELSNNSPGYQTFDMGEHIMHVGNAGKDDMCEWQDEATVVYTPYAKRLRAFSK